MADKYERFLMKEKLKEARHQAKIDELRRKKELSEIKEHNAQSASHLIVALIPLIVVLAVIAFYVYILSK